MPFMRITLTGRAGAGQACGEIRFSIVKFIANAGIASGSRAKIRRKRDALGTSNPSRLGLRVRPRSPVYTVDAGIIAHPAIHFTASNAPAWMAHGAMRY
jgi:hypothetical protein